LIVRSIGCGLFSIAEKSDFPGSSAFRDRNSVLLLGDVKCDKKLRYAFPWSALRA
jgi:hypothetical protein